MAETKFSKKFAVESIIPTPRLPERSQATSSAPVNIALVKYWGKRNEDLRLPVTDSLSVALSLKTTTSISQADQADEIYLNGQSLSTSPPFTSELCSFFNFSGQTQDFSLEYIQ